MKEAMNDYRIPEVQELKLKEKWAEREFNVLKIISKNVMQILGDNFNPENYKYELTDLSHAWYEDFIKPLMQNNVDLKQIKIDVFSTKLIGKISHPNIKNIFIPIISPDLEWKNLTEDNKKEIKQLYKEYHELTSIKDIDKVFEEGKKIQDEIELENIGNLNISLQTKEYISHHKNYINELRRLMGSQIFRNDLIEALYEDCSFDDLFYIFCIIKEYKQLTFDQKLNILVDFLTKIKIRRDKFNFKQKELLENIKIKKLINEENDE
jgi:hypothetical protein